MNGEIWIKHQSKSFYKIQCTDGWWKPFSMALLLLAEGKSGKEDRKVAESGKPFIKYQKLSFILGL